MIEWIFGIAFYIAGMVATAYCIGRFTSPDHLRASSEIRELAPVLVPLWPILALSLLVIPFGIAFSGGFLTSKSILNLPLRVGDAHRIEWESRTKMLVAHDEEYTRKLEEDIKELERLADEARSRRTERS